MNGDAHGLPTNGSLTTGLGVSPIPPLSAMAVGAGNLAGPPGVPLQGSISSPLPGVGPPPGALLPPAGPPTIPSMFLQPRSPAQMLCHIEADQKDELEMMIQELEQENRQLQAEYERLQDMR